MISESNIVLDLQRDLVDLATYRQDDRIAGGKHDALIVYLAYAQDASLYDEQGRIYDADPAEYARCKTSSHPKESNRLVNKFRLVYDVRIPMLQHRKLADVLIDTAIDMRDRHHQYTIVFDALRTYDSAWVMGKNRQDLVDMKLLAPAGKSAHNRALAVDSKLFTADGAPTLATLAEADEHGHFDDTGDLKMPGTPVQQDPNHRFYNGAMSASAKANRLNRLRAWQRASVKHKTPVANLLAEFWDDRTCGSPADMWRIISCRAMCIEDVDPNPLTNTRLGELRTTLNALHAQQEEGKLTRQDFATQAHGHFVEGWNVIFNAEARTLLAQHICLGAQEPPALADFAPVFHEWIETIHDRHLEAAAYPRQCLTRIEAAA